LRKLRAFWAPRCLNIPGPRARGSLYFVSFYALAIGGLTQARRLTRGHARQPGIGLFTLTSVITFVDYDQR